LRCIRLHIDCRQPLFQLEEKNRALRHAQVDAMLESKDDLQRQALRRSELSTTCSSYSSYLSRPPSSLCSAAPPACGLPVRPISALDKRSHFPH
jgi:hypothetical protein